ncbi:MAG: Rpn family recombination-promoting nuclease/putative transposase [Acidobacteria bacterium]|nr:Rpn family recombination-promoting nuclease/putative transposase [Acidobacteriota bacterium]
MSEITTPHDSFCKEIMARPEVAADFMANYLPPDVVARLDLSGLELVKDSFVDEELRKHFSDLLYRVPFRDGGEAFIYILFEHKSRPDDWAAFQLLRYEMKIWEPMARSREGKLPPIFPIVFYHGQERWSAPRDFVGLIADAPDGGGTHSLIRYIYSDDLGARLPGIFSPLSQLSPEAAMGFLSVALRYLSIASHRLNVEDVRMAIQGVFPPDEYPVIAPFALTWMEEGKQEGRQEGAAAFALRLLRKRFGEVGEETEAQIESLSLESLEKLGEDLLDFASLEDLTLWLRAQVSTESQTTN